MNTPELELRLKRAAAVAAPPRSIVNDVMRQVGSAPPDAVPRLRWRHPVIAAGVAALSGLAAIAAVIFFLTSTVHFSLADVQNAFEGQRWVHVRFDSGQIKDNWTNLQTGETYAARTDGDAVYINDQANIRLWHWKDSAVIEQDTLTVYSPGQTPPNWTPQTAWGEFVAPFAQAASTTQPSGSMPGVVAVKDMLNGVSVMRFDMYGTDAVGARFLYSQLWADPDTHLPLRIKTRLQLGEREQYGKEFSTGDYDFPTTGPADIYALGVPRDMPIHKSITVAPVGVQPVLDCINHAFDNFLKNYRAIVWIVRPNSVAPMESFSIIWRDGDKVRQDRHLPAVELQNVSIPPLPKLTEEALLAWDASHEPLDKQFMDSEHEYSWHRPTSGPSQPQVQVIRHDRFPLLSTNEWPEYIQWPTRDSGPDFHLLDANPDTPDGCIGLRNDSAGNYRCDYFIDPANDYVCMKEIRWTMRGTIWVKTSECTVSDLRRINGCVVVGRQRVHEYADPVQKTSDGTLITTIQLVPLAAADCPPGTFDPTSLTTGAKIEGY